MALPDSLSDRLFYNNNKQYSEQEGNVAYLDRSGLRRPFEMPMAQRIIAAVIVVVAIFIGYTIVDRTVLNSYREEATFQKTLEENLARQSSIETLPKSVELMPRDNEGIIAWFNEAGFGYYDMTEMNDSYELMLCKLPSDMTADEVASYYANGIGALSATQATKLLNGSWTLGVDRANGTMITRYVDFKTGDPQIAVQNALANQGFDPATVAESGTDDSGNTFASSTVETEGGLCVWKISALPLDDIYSIRGMPEDACYVGIRLSYA